MSWANSRVWARISSRPTGGLTRCLMISRRVISPAIRRIAQGKSKNILRKLCIDLCLRRVAADKFALNQESPRETPSLRSGIFYHGERDGFKVEEEFVQVRIRAVISD